MINAIASHILGLPPWVALLVVFALPALESSAFVGFIFPGEVALILGGVMAYEGSVSLGAVLAAGIAGAVIGDSVGYAIGRRYGRRLLDGTVGRFVKSSHIDRGEKYLASRGGRAVFFGRFTAALRVLIPGLAGMSGLRYRTFLVFNVAGGVAWATMAVLLGYLGGSSWRHVERVASHIGLAVLAVVVVTMLVGVWRFRRSGAAARFSSSSPTRRHVSTRPPDHEGTGRVSSPTSQPDQASAADAHPPKSQPMPHSRTYDALHPGRTLVVIPTYNEAGNISTALDRVRVAVPHADILVVDDNSPDSTAALVEQHRDYTADDTDGLDGSGHVFLLSRAGKDGLGAAYRAGFTWALTHGYEAVVQMDADLSHPAERIPALLDSLESADVVVGSRYVPGGEVSNWSLSRRLISRVGNNYVRLVLRLPVHDTTAGFKAFRRDTLERIGAVDSTSNGYCYQVENTWRAARLGLRVIEVPICFTDRTEGTSKMSGVIVVEALARVLAWRWVELRHRTGEGRHYGGAPETPTVHKVGAHRKSAEHHAVS